MVLLSLHYGFIYWSTVGRDSSGGTATRYGLDGSGIESRWGARFSHPSRPAQGLTQPLSGSFPEVNRLGRDVDQPTQSSAKIKEKVELYLYSSSGPSRPVLGWNLLLPVPFPLPQGISILRLQIFRDSASSEPISCFQGRFYVGYGIQLKCISPCVYVSFSHYCSTFRRFSLCILVCCYVI